MKIKKLISIFLISNLTLFAAGGYDHGTPAGKGNIDIDITINPEDVVGDIDYIGNGQSYLVWGYGITDTLDFHGYVSQEFSGASQVYYGLMQNFLDTKYLDLSTAIGFRHREDIVDTFFPQILYTLKLAYDFEVGGSIVNVYNLSKNNNRGQTYDIALRIPMNFEFTKNYFKDLKLSVGFFRPLGGKFYPTYSIDMKF